MTDLAVKRPASGMPKGVLIFAAVLVAITVAGALRTLGSPASGARRRRRPRSVQSLALRFEDQPDGAVLVRRAVDGAMIYRIAPETNGFMRSTLRGLVRERRHSGFGDATPFVVTAWSDGRISLDDATTGRHVALEAFGATNEGAFAQLFRASGAVR